MLVGMWEDRNKTTNKYSHIDTHNCIRVRISDAEEYSRRTRETQRLF